MKEKKHILLLTTGGTIACAPSADGLVPHHSGVMTFQIDQLRAIVNDCNVPVMCFGLRTDFQTRLFPGSRRLMELADCIEEIKTMCDCGAKATVNARIDCNGHIVTEGAQVVLGGNDSYIAMCHRCYIHGIRDHKKIKLHGQK